MTTSKQLSFLEETVSEQQFIWFELADLKTKQNNLRRGLFQRFEELQKEIDMLRGQIILMTSKNKDVV